MIAINFSKSSHFKQTTRKGQGKPLIWGTPQKFNMEPEDDGFQKESPFLGADLQVPC